MKRIASLERGLLVMDFLRRSGPMSLAEVTQRSGLPKPTVLRILRTLAAAGVAHQGLADRLWRLSPQNNPATGNDDPDARLTEIAGVMLDALCRKVLWPSDIGVYRDGAIQVLENSRRMSPFLVNRDVISQRIHVLPSAMGRAILAWSSADIRERILSELPVLGGGIDRALPPAADLDASLARIRARGYAARQKGYFVSIPREGRVMAIAVPVDLGQGRVAAVNLSWVASAMTETDFVGRHLDELSATARHIEAALRDTDSTAISVPANPGKYQK
ncbi:helix-turn-helix domain-containing protein [Roseinatronobacter alkalisoli]|uniref:Helix-turn-helix domain-containing protein n=1 Tax=Roseinatronobacter alkalisoli TaxID=3028235 RepID=A0ABT5TC41_9RHOB|nr:helix-turn-helix domain-containing protein [Roseinatronobacter sp. HJB301]MDD7972697.1 helix-turn-helix domain-containing protein [Roseinatronobacter sp. HJB301]